MKAKTTLPIFSYKDFAISIISATSSNYILLAIIFASISFDGFSQSLVNGQTVIEHHHSCVGSTLSQDKLGFNPFSNFYSTSYGNSRSSRTQMLYTHDEFTDSGATWGTITQISFKLDVVLAANSFLKCSDFTVRLGLTDIQSFKDDNLQYIPEYDGSLQECRTGPITITESQYLAGNGWVTIILTQPFTYAFTGNKNLIVEIAKTIDPASMSMMKPKIMVANYPADPKQYGVRGCLGNATSGLIDGKDMYTNIDPTLNSTATRAANYNAIGRSNRPSIKFTYEANEINSQGVEYIGVPTSVICLGDQIVIKADNMYATGYQGHQWEMTTAPETGYIDIPYQTSSILQTAQPAVKTYYRYKSILPSGNTVEFATTTCATVKGIKTFDDVAGIKKWVDDAVPASGESAYYKVTPASWPIAGDLMDLCSLKLDPGVILNVPSGKTLKLDKTLKSDEVTGRIIFENNSSLLQTTTNENELVDIIYKRESQPLLRFDYTYYSSPVVGKNLFSVSPQTLTDKFWSYSNNGWVMENASTVMMPGKGYIIRGPQTFPISGTPAPFPTEFEGIVNNGNISIPGDPVLGNFNLIGNPYPSAIDASKFVYANNFLDGSIYLWTHEHQPSTAYPGTATYNYSNEDYSAMNQLGSTNGPSLNIVGAGQSFMIKTIAAGANNVQWKNDMRVAGQNSVFYKMQNPNLDEHNVQLSQKVAAPINAEPAGRFWLNLQTNSGAVQNILIGYVQGATEGYDRMYDAEPMEIGATGLYAIANDQQRLSIMAKGLPFDNETIIPLGFVTAVPGNHTISKFKEDGFIADYAVYINDKLTNTTHNLSEGPYEFATSVGTFDNRFIIAFKPKTVQLVDSEVKQNKVVVFDKFETVQLHSGVNIMQSITVYDLSGRVLVQVNNCNSTEVALSKLNRKNQLLLVEIHLENGEIETQKYRF